MQLLFEGSEETPGVAGLEIIKGQVTKFNASDQLKVPQIGWNGFSKVKASRFLDEVSINQSVSRTL